MLKEQVGDQRGSVGVEQRFTGNEFAQAQWVKAVLDSLKATIEKVNAECGGLFDPVISQLQFCTQKEATAILELGGSKYDPLKQAIRLAGADQGIQSIIFQTVPSEKTPIFYDHNDNRPTIWIRYSNYANLLSSQVGLVAVAGWLLAMDLMPHMLFISTPMRQTKDRRVAELLQQKSDWIFERLITMPEHFLSPEKLPQAQEVLHAMTTLDSNVEVFLRGAVMALVTPSTLGKTPEVLLNRGLDFDMELRYLLMLAFQEQFIQEWLSYFAKQRQSVIRHALLSEISHVPLDIAAARKEWSQVFYEQFGMRPESSHRSQDPMVGLARRLLAPYSRSQIVTLFLERGLDYPL